MIKTKYNAVPRLSTLIFRLSTLIFRLSTLIFVGITLIFSSVSVQAQEHVLNLKDADIRAFIEDISVVTGKTFIVDPRVTGLVTVSSQAQLTKQEVFSVFQDVLRVRGFIATPTASGAYRISLLQGAAQDAPLSGRYNDQTGFITEILKLSYGDAVNAAKLIKPILHTQGRLTSASGGRILVVTDYPENILKARKIIEAMAVDQAVVEIIHLTHINANDAVKAIKELVGIGGTDNTGRNRAQVGAIRQSVRAVAIEVSNTLILRGDPADVAQLKEMVLKMDTPSAISQGQISVMSLRFANGEDIVTILDKLILVYSAKEFRGTGEPAPSVAYNKGSNSIIISGSAEIQQRLESLVRRLDVRRPQVLVEAIIVEMSDTAAEDLGLQFLLAGNDGSALPFISTNYSRSAPNLLGIAGALTDNNNVSADARSAAISSLLGLNGGTFGIGGNGSDGVFGVILNAVRNDTDSNILSTPFVTTLDNVPAYFLVGQEVPFTSGETLGTDNSNPFRTIQREEIGIKLKVLPQISSGDVIRLQIKQEVSSISSDASIRAVDLITNKREIETTVLVNDGEIIVLGGLIQDDEQLFQSKVPVLGDIPIIGNLFKSHNNTKRRTNLMVFIRPTIIRDGQDSNTLTQDKIDYMIMQERLYNNGNTQHFQDTLNRMEDK